MIDFGPILRKYKPSEEQNRALKQTASEVMGRINAILEQKKIKAKSLLVGSVAKGTNLASGDIDLFVIFSKDYSSRDMERLGLMIGHEVLPEGREKYAEHPYVSGQHGDRKVDIVPCFEINPGTRIISSVDRTPLHTDFVLKNLNAEGQDQVRLLKLFMKGIGVYGSEIKVSGFSGYVCELLVIKYGSMLKVLETFASLKGKMRISLEEGDMRDFDAPIVIIDPTDITRNAAAAISIENLSRMKINSRMFLANPVEHYFNTGAIYFPEKYRERGTVMRIFTLEKPDIIDDILFSQANRFRNILVQILEEDGFMPISSEVDLSDDIEAMVECKLGKLPATKVHVGPPVDAQNAIDFIRKWSVGKATLGPYVCGDRLCADIPVEKRELEEVVRERINGFVIGKNIDQFKAKMKIIDPSKSTRKFLVLGKFYSKVLPGLSP
ncbi:MAG: CCA tRNA nucleotidyltransferase [Thermoplasmatales archaeon]|nr:CCA tRNA nucleotidyltransferase [Candidatus Thermoplasmatota archaeon]MDA8143776.1 CCA tRNA nucleotidyltransferase [Thermoplasmatales archaeon]